MTVIEGLCEQVRTPERWPHTLGRQMPLTDVNYCMVGCVASVPRPSSITMRLSPCTRPRWLVIILEPANTDTAQLRHQVREQFSLETGVRLPNHTTDTDHISLAYNLLWLTDDEERMMHGVQQEVQYAVSAQYPSLVLGAPQFTYVEDMFRCDNAW